MSANAFFILPAPWQAFRCFGLCRAFIFALSSHHSVHAQGRIIHHWKKERFSLSSDMGSGWLKEMNWNKMRLISKVIFILRFHKEKIYMEMGAYHRTIEHGQSFPSIPISALSVLFVMWTFLFPTTTVFWAIRSAKKNSDGPVERAVHVINAENSTAWRNFHSALILHVARV